MTAGEAISTLENLSSAKLMLRERSEMQARADAIRALEVAAEDAHRKRDDDSRRAIARGLTAMEEKVTNKGEIPLPLSLAAIVDAEKTGKKGNPFRIG